MDKQAEIREIRKNERESLPSEKAPAPANPVVMEQGLQPTHCLVVRLGHCLFSMERPFSLEQACLTLKALVEKDRLIGIISHVPELAEKIENQIYFFHH